MKKILALTGLALGFGLLLTVKLPAHNPIWVSLQNSGHALVFAGLFCAAYYLLSSLKSQISTPWRIAGAFIICTVLALLSEFIQQFLANRAATVSDLIFDGVGIIAGVMIVFLVRRGSRIVVRLACFVVASSLLLTAFYEPISWSASYRYRDNNAPVLVDFESVFENNFHYVNASSLDVSVPPPSWKEKPGASRVGKITYLKGRWPVFKFQHVYPDWTGYETISFEIFNAEAERVRMTFRIDDIHHNYTNEDRLDYRYWAEPGHNKITIPLTVVRDAPENRETDMENIKDIMWMAHQVETPKRIYLDNVRLN